MAGANGGLQGYNLFVYCFNNPIAFVDANGNWPSWKDVEGFLKKIGDTVEKMAKTFVDSLEADIGVGFGLGANISDNITIEASRDTYVAFDDGEVVTGNIITAEVSLFDKSIVGETYNHIVEIAGKRVSKASPYDGPFDMVNYPDVKKGNYITIGPFSLNDEMDFVVSLSASLHVLFGGHVSVGFNVTEYFERIFD